MQPDHSLRAGLTLNLGPPVPFHLLILLWPAVWLLRPLTLRQSGGGTGASPSHCIKRFWTANKSDPDLQGSTKESHSTGDTQQRL